MEVRETSDCCYHCPFCGHSHDPRMSCEENDRLDRLSIVGMGTEASAAFGDGVFFAQIGNGLKGEG